MASAIREVTRDRIRRRLLALACVIAVAAGGGAFASSEGTSVLRFDRPFALPAPGPVASGSSDGTEPRVAVTPNGGVFVIWAPFAHDGHAVVWRSFDGGRTFRPAPGELPGQAPDVANVAASSATTLATSDVDIAATRTGRLIAVEEDGAGGLPRLVAGYSDDAGRSWHSSLGPTLDDQDRPYLAVGPDDPVTHQPRVYLLFHNLFSSVATHNMFVETSRDGGATFGPPVPVTAAGSPAWQDLQCGDSGGPSGLFVDARSGRVYVVWGTRTAAVAGGCGASVFGAPEINVVGATRIWIAAASAASVTMLGGWRTAVAVDDSPANHGGGRIVSMELSPGAVDHAGNVYVAYAESPHPYPNYTGAAIKYVWSPVSLQRWSRPVTVAAGGDAGNVLPHIVAGNRGRLDFGYFHGLLRPGEPPAWQAVAAQTLNGLVVRPRITTVAVADGLATYTGTASQLMGICAQSSDPRLAAAEQGFVCSRSTDVFGIALNAHCNLVLAWPVADHTFNDADPQDVGTYVSTQIDGPTICAH